jgi:hypothetical protein
MLIETTVTDRESSDGDPAHDRIMLALQYLTALVAAAAAGLLGFVR